jgi:hypothetical protein
MLSYDDRHQRLSCRFCRKEGAKLDMYSHLTRCPRLTRRQGRLLAAALFRHWSLSKRIMPQRPMTN